MDQYCAESNHYNTGLLILGSPMAYKKMAGTAAVFILADQHANSPVERDGMIWTDGELHLDTIPEHLTPKDPMATSLALEGLESYDPPSHGDIRQVTALSTCFVYLETAQGWVELPEQ